MKPTPPKGDLDVILQKTRVFKPAHRLWRHFCSANAPQIESNKGNCMNTEKESTQRRHNKVGALLMGEFFFAEWDNAFNTAISTMLVSCALVMYVLHT